MIDYSIKHCKTASELSKLGENGRMERILVDLYYFRIEGGPKINSLLFAVFILKNEKYVWDELYVQIQKENETN